MPTPFMPARPRRIRSALLVLMSSLFLLSACATATPSADRTADDDWSPVTVGGAFGETTVNDRPERVFALSTTDADMLLAVGITPIAVPSMPQTDAATGGTSVYPWQEDLYPTGVPKVEASTTELSIEGIAATRPDLIVGTAFFGLTQENYDRLSEVAPVVHYDTVANSDPWQDSTRKIAEAVGRAESGDTAIAEAEAALQQVREDYPSLTGTTYNAVISPSPEGVWILCSELDNMSRVMTEFGMELSDYAQTVACDGGKTEVSWENVPKLDADVLWAIPDTPDQMHELDDQRLWQALPAVARDAVAVVPKTEGVPFAVAFPSPLSLAWAAERLAPELSEAVDRG